MENEASEKNASVDASKCDTKLEEGVPKSLPNPFQMEIPPGAITGLLQACGTELTEVERDLKELTGKQAEMIEKVGEHNRLLENNPQLDELKYLMDNMKAGLEKLSLVRQEMSTIHERSEKLKERAEKLANLRRAAERKEDELVAQLDVGVEDGQDSASTASAPTATATPKDEPSVGKGI